jgi:hypothetical protein
MTVSSTTARVSYSGNGTTVSFAVPFYFLADAHLLVVLRNSSGIETTQVLSTNYSVTGAGVQSGGTVTMTVAPSSGSSLLITRNVPLTQGTDFLPNDRLPADSLEQTIDKLTMIAQQIDEVTDRALRVPASDSASLNLTLPSSVTRASKVLAFTSTGEPTVANAPTSGFVDPADYGAAGNGTTDDTVALRSAFGYAIPRNLAVILKGTYLISDYIGLNANVASGALHIFCNGSVTINVSASATAFRQVLFFGCNASTDVSISGGPLTINCNNKAAVGLDIYTASASLSGSINFTSQVTVNDAKANDAAATYENGGIVISGRFAVISMISPRIINVSRTNTSGGACYGIAITDFAGECLVSKPYIENVLCPNGTAGVDADGIKVFGVNNAASPAVQTLGKATIEGGTFIDCQGRSIKSQCSDTVVNNPYFKRQYHVSIVNGHDVDFQSGNGVLVNPTFEYRKNGATSPLGTSHIPVSFQQRVSNLPQASRMSGGSLKTEVDMRNLVLLTQESTSAYSETVVEDLTIETFGTLSTTVFTRSILETDMEQINGKTAGTRVVLRGITGPMNCYAFGYTGYTVGSLAAKLDYELTDITNTLAPTSANLLFWNLSGNRVGEVKAFLMRDNANFRDLLPEAVFNFNALVPGCRFNILTDAVTATNAPAWGSGNYALVEALAGPNDTAPLTPTNRNVRVTVTDGATNAVENVFFSPNGGTTWSEELFGVTSGTTKTVTGLLSVDGQLQLGGTVPAYVKFNIGGTLPSNIGATYSAVNAGTIPSTTTDYVAYRTGAATQDAAFTLGSYIHYWSTQGTVTGGSRTAPTTQYGFAIDSNLIGATTNYAFFSQMPSGSGRWNFYSAGTAPSYFVGALCYDSSTLTIASGAVTATRNYHLLAGEGGAADDLTNITAATQGHLLVLRAASDSVTITVKSTGNIKTAGSDMVLDNQHDTITLIYDGALALWLEIARSNNGA